MLIPPSHTDRIESQYRHVYEHSKTFSYCANNLNASDVIVYINRGGLRLRLVVRSIRGGAECACHVAKEVTKSSFLVIYII